jgi:hypothetical protein
VSFCRRRSTHLVIAALAGSWACGDPGAPPKAEYDPRTGHLQRLSADINHDGRRDAVAVLDGTRIDRIELDLDENGKVERWDYYNGLRQVQSVGFSRLDDGVLDARAFYGANGQVARIEVSTRRDGLFNRVEFYEDGRLTHATEDSNGDGRVDRWETYQPNPHAGRNEPPYALTSLDVEDAAATTPSRRHIDFSGARTANTWKAGPR